MSGNTLGVALKEVRESLGFKTGRSFFLHLKALGDINFNYSYYLRIEKGQVLPSALVIETIAFLIGSEDGDRLILAFCRALFTKRFHHLFAQNFLLSKGKSGAEKKISSLSTGRARILSERQIFVIAKSEHHYQLFLVLTLARSPISLSVLERLFGPEKLKSPLEELVSAKLVARNETGFFPTQVERKFPEPFSRPLQESYDRMDTWDLNLGQSFGFDSLLKKIFIRRVSSRYIHLILGTAELLCDLVRASDEIDQKLNEEVLTLQIKVSQGRLPG